MLKRRFNPKDKVYRDMTRKYNFGAGPAALPEVVLAKARDEMMDWEGGGASIMEISHRSPEFTNVAVKAENDFRDLLQIPDEYAVLFMHGGASMQFSAVPLNLLGEKKSADYVNTGMWSKKAIAEAKRYCDPRVVANSEANNFTSIPAFDQWTVNSDAAYLHYTANETIGGVEFNWMPDVDVPKVVDMSSNILSRPLEVGNYGLIYAGAQKNIGPAGLSIVVVHRNLLDRARAITPALLNYKVIADNDSMYNTPPTFALYLAGLVFQWLKDQGGLVKIEEVNRRKAAKLYRTIDDSSFYTNSVEIASRSLMNVPFTLANSDLDSLFLEEARQIGLLNLKGHRSVGGMRASIYNAVTEQAVDELIQFMRVFEQTNG